MNYKKTYVPAKGYTPICKIGECSLKKLEFGIIELDAGEKLPFDTEDREVAFIMLEGHCNVPSTVSAMRTWETAPTYLKTARPRASICPVSSIWRSKPSTISRSPSAAHP